MDNENIKKNTFKKTLSINNIKHRLLNTSFNPNETILRLFGLWLIVAVLMAQAVHLNIEPSVFDKLFFLLVGGGVSVSASKFLNRTKKRLYHELGYENEIVTNATHEENPGIKKEIDASKISVSDIAVEAQDGVPILISHTNNSKRENSNSSEQPPKKRARLN